MRIDSSRILITGASSGIGNALATELGVRGAVLGLIARRAAPLAELIAARGPTDPASRYWSVDLADPEQAAAVAVEAWDALGHIDAVVNNAGMPMRRHVTRLEPGDVERVFAVNFLAPLRITLAVLPKMLDRGRGTVVNVGSTGGRIATPRQGAYSASKAALSSFTESLFLDLRHTPVDVYLVQPGGIDTPLWDQPFDEPVAVSRPATAASEVVDVVVDALENGGPFERFVPEAGAEWVERKGRDIEAVLGRAAADDDRAAAEFAGRSTQAGVSR